MRILHVATLFSPDGAYGGPTRVANNLAAELGRRGHQVLLAGAARGFDRMPAELGGVPARLAPARQVLPGIGYAGLAAPGLLPMLRGLTPAPDVVHVHLARDLVTLPAAQWALRRGLPLVVQTHGMIDASDRLLAKPLDLAWTIPVLRGAEKVYCLTPSEVEDIHHVAGSGVRTAVLPNGIPDPIAGVTPQQRAGVVYIGRLHERKRPMMFVQMAQQAIADGLSVDFDLFGPDEGEGDAVREALRADDGGGRIRWSGALAPENVPQRLATAAVLVNTTDNERFGMSVIEAMAAGCVVIVGESCGLATILDQHDAGIVVPESTAAYVAALKELHSDPNRMKNLADRGRQLALDRFGIAGVVDQVEQDYRALTAERNPL
ncbi:MAG: glycosyltransferase [Propionibacteriaceae bacterium]|nr:glycosyltransferase [Propionibacteriaceae bacterium]